MAGPINIDPTKPPRREPEFGTATTSDVQPFLGIMRVLREATVAPAFTRLLTDDVQVDDEVPLAHIFEEISTLAVHGLIAEDLLFDAFAIDIYWERLKHRVQAVREKSEHPKFCENFEICANLARAYREGRPSKLAYRAPA
ncbi:MAG: hypothetical protein J2P40_07495 [Candidatus Dormibacteraeota bacterium]|nr:hypothetical protein [Candidatus Dormibacteraeota bacterium]MBO0704357.1 hypothetical protein [Candidatus Dormibacteraeota bacterium]MBO0761102.1 hypothetical protein [Candidatus Dormibacteraeota bacterium]